MAPLTHPQLFSDHHRTHLGLLDCWVHLGGGEKLQSRNGLGGLELHHGHGLDGGRAEAYVGADIPGFLWTGAIKTLKSPLKLTRLAKSRVPLNEPQATNHARSHSPLCYLDKWPLHLHLCPTEKAQQHAVQMVKCIIVEAHIVSLQTDQMPWGTYKQSQQLVTPDLLKHKYSH